MNNEPLSLYELNALVKQSIKSCLPDSYWVRAELSDVKPNRMGHCYVEFVQKSDNADALVAKARGIIWSNIYSMLKPYFEESTGQPFASGIKVLVRVNVDFHELYGYSLTVIDIDPAYTLGDMARRRREILRRLDEEGVLSLNKELAIPMLPQRVAVISSATAAGYGDFCDQLLNNNRGYRFYPSLFPAIMQGDRVEASVIAALDEINSCRDDYDVVVIIRGGGATSDLSGFDTYPLAANCAQFPLPIITGIGHERDDTVIDIVSNTRVKTPTAAAALLIEKMDYAAMLLERCSAAIDSGAAAMVEAEGSRLEGLRRSLATAITGRLNAEKYRGERLSLVLSNSFQRRRVMEEVALAHLLQRIGASASAFIERERHRIAMAGQGIKGSSPEEILKKGYSMTLKGGKVLRDAASVQEGDELVTLLYGGEIKSRVTKK